MAGVGRIMLWSLAFAWVLGLPGCRRGDRRVLSVVGSTSIQPFAEMLAEAYNAQQHGLEVEVQGGGSTAGIQAVTTGIAHIGMCSRNLKPQEKFTPILIARDGIALVVHPSNPVKGLSLAQIRELFSGRAANWRDVGGADAAVRVITREEGSGTREAFVKLVMAGERISRRDLTQESNGAVKELVRHDPGAIGYMSLGLVGQELRTLQVDGTKPSRENVLNGSYPLVRPFLFVVAGQPSPDAQGFIAFVLGQAAQEMLEREGLVRAK